MDIRYHDDLSDEKLISLVDDDATTIHEMEIEEMLKTEVARDSMLEHCDGGRIASQGRELQLPASVKTIYESWTIAFQQPTRRLRGWTTCLGCTVSKTVAVEPGKIVAVTPATYFEQEDLAEMAACARSQHISNSRHCWTPRRRGVVGPEGDYDDDDDDDDDDELEHRLRQLDASVQRELYSLLRDRSESTSNSFRRRKYKLVMLLEVSGATVTDRAVPQVRFRTCQGSSDERRNKKKNRWWDVFWGEKSAALPHVCEYRVILRGCETAATDAGWGVYHRYSQPWRFADEAGLAGVREKMGYQELLG